MRSLHSRLLMVIMTTVMLGWMASFATMYLLMTSQESGKWDLLLKNASEQLLQSLPSDIETTLATRRLALPHEEVADAGKFKALVFQVWIPGTGQNVLMSANAPATPMVAGFNDGFTDVVIDGRAIRVFAVTDTTGKVQVQTGQLVSIRDAEMMQLLKGSLLAALALMAVLALCIWTVICWSLAPVDRLAQSISQRDDADLTPLSPVGLPRELLPLVGAFNGLLAKFSGAIERERQFLGDAAHELRTPLAALLAHAQVAQHARSQAEADAALSKVIAGIERTSRLAQQLLDSARVDSERSSYQRATLDLSSMVALVAEEFDALIDRKGQALELDLEPAFVDGNLDDLGILVRNLIDNAVRYGPKEGRIDVRVQAAPGDRTVVLTIRDEGPGVPEDERPHLFERFFRGSTGNGERGSGIGLFLVAQIARSHGASVRLTPGAGGTGLGVEVTFRAAEVTA